MHSSFGHAYTSVHIHQTSLLRFHAVTRNSIADLDHIWEFCWRFLNTKLLFFLPQGISVGRSTAYMKFFAMKVFYNEMFLQWIFFTMKLFYNEMFLQWNFFTMNFFYNEIFLQWHFFTMKFFYNEIFLQWNFLTIKNCTIIFFNNEIWKFVYNEIF